MKKNAKSKVMLCKKYVDMDVTAVKLKLHPKAKDLLFNHYATLRRIFSDVVGQLETDYISLALIDEKGQIFFFSSKPSIEQNLIEKNLWQYDGNYQPEFIYQNKPKLWSELNHRESSNLLKRYKEVDHNLITGISIPHQYEDYRVIFTFGFKKINPLIQKKAQIYNEKLLAMGKFCLSSIQAIVPFPEKQYIETRPKLKLIINNQVSL